MFVFTNIEYYTLIRLDVCVCSVFYFFVGQDNLSGSLSSRLLCNTPPQPDPFQTHFKFLDIIHTVYGIRAAYRNESLER